MTTICPPYTDAELQCLKPNCARITHSGGLGTGFLIAKGLLLTCNHVMTEGNDGRAIEKASCSFGDDRSKIFEFKVQDRYPDVDCAVLVADDSQELPDIATLSVASFDNELIGPWWAWGFPAYVQAKGIPLWGSVADGSSIDSDFRNRLQLHATPLQGEDMQLGGFSGSPVIVGGKIIGMLLRTVAGTEDGKQARLGMLYAIPFSHNHPIFSEKYAKLLSASNLLQRSILQNVPPPWAGVAQGAVPSVQTMYDRVDERVGGAPLNLGTMWGLDRGSFVGVLLAAQSTRLCNDLKNVERVLYEAQDSVARAVRLPARWWIEADPSKFPSGPQSARQIGEATTNASDPLAAFVAAGGFPAGVIPGVLLRLPGSATSEHVSAIVNWCRELASEALGSPAVLVVIEGPDGQASRAQAAMLTAALRDIGMPVDTMRLGHRFSQDAPADRDRTYTPTSPAGYLLYCWLLELLDRIDGAHAQLLYPEVYFFKDELATRFSRPSPPLPMEDALSVVVEIGKIIPEPSSFHRQFLQLIASVAQDRLPCMIAAYAKSGGFSARREALFSTLRLGLTSEVDALMNAWVDGSELNEAHFPSGAGLIADPELGSFVDALTLALLRRFDANPDSIRRILEQLPQTNVLGRVRALRMRDEDDCLEKFLDSFGSEEYLMAARAGVEIAFPLEKYVDQLDIWWLLLALSPTKGRAIELLSLDKKYRAIVGLVTTEEWQSILHDAGTVRSIEERRHGHVMYRRIRNHSTSEDSQFKRE